MTYVIATCQRTLSLLISLLHSCLAREQVVFVFLSGCVRIEDKEKLVISRRTRGDTI